MIGGLNPMQQLIALLSGTQMQQAAPPPPPTQVAAQETATVKTPMMAAPLPPPPAAQTTTVTTGHYNHSGDWIPDTVTIGGGDGDGHHGDKGDKGEEEVPLSHIQQVMQDAIDTGPTGYIPAIRKNLGMNTPTIGYGDPPKNNRSAIATRNFMDLFMGGRNRGGA